MPRHHIPIARSGVAGSAVYTEFVAALLPERFAEVEVSFAQLKAHSNDADEGQQAPFPRRTLEDLVPVWEAGRRIRQALPFITRFRVE